MPQMTVEEAFKSAKKTISLYTRYNGRRLNFETPEIEKAAIQTGISTLKICDNDYALEIFSKHYLHPNPEIVLEPGIARDTLQKLKKDLESDT